MDDRMFPAETGRGPGQRRPHVYFTSEELDIQLKSIISSIIAAQLKHGRNDFRPELLVRYVLQQAQLQVWLAEQTLAWQMHQATEILSKTEIADALNLKRPSVEQYKEIHLKGPGTGIYKGGNE